jgi:hypothetical protein
MTVRFAAADLRIAHANHGVLFVELAFGVFVGLLHAFHVSHDVQRASRSISTALVSPYQPRMVWLSPRDSWMVSCWLTSQP